MKGWSSVTISCALALLCGSAFAQTGTLSGTITDPGNAAVPGAQAQVKEVSTGLARTAPSGGEGIFRFNSLPPGTYNLTIQASGFKAYTQQAITVDADQVRDLGTIKLALGALTEAIMVTAAATPVDTASSDNSKLVDINQMEALTMKGRDMFAMMVTIPGVSEGTSFLTGGDTTNLDTGIDAFQINGGGTQRTNFSVDGITDFDTGSNGGVDFEPTMDSIAEIRVLSTNSLAEIGRETAEIQVVTKSGGKEFHGVAYANKRHEEFNAKNFFNNFNGTPKSFYRYFIWGYTIGGPIYIPKVFNTQKNRLFFFFSQEYTRQRPATQSGYNNVPTTAQDAGNFAGYANSNGVQSSLTDPSTGNPVPNNNIAGLVLDPAAAAVGQAMLGFFPAANICGHTGVPTSGCITDAQYATQQYSRDYYWSFNIIHPRRNDTARVDIYATSKMNIWGRWSHDYDLTTTATPNSGNGGPAQLNSQGQWTSGITLNPNPGHGFAAGFTYTISPTLVDEFTWGWSTTSWDWYPTDQGLIARSRMGNPPSFDNFATDPVFTNNVGERPTQSAGPQNFQVGVPSVAFGGGQEASEVAFTGDCDPQCPYTNFNPLWSFDDKISKVVGKHSFKVGGHWEHYTKVEPASGNYMGSYSFASSSTFPNNTQDGFANAYLGNFASYNEQARTVQNTYATIFQFFVQDEWRVSRRVTVDYGVRAYYGGEYDDRNNENAEFVRAAYNPAAAPHYYYPYCTISTATKACPAADQKAYDPASGTYTFYPRQGTFVPYAVGGYTTPPNYADGMVVAAPGNPYGLPPTLWTTPLLSPAVRFGLAWDVFGNGRTAVRAGFGQFLEMTSMHPLSAYESQPPVTFNKTVYYSTIDQIPSFAATAAIPPTSPGGMTGNQRQQSTYNGSLMVQQNVGFSTVVEASYVFNLGRHLVQSRLVNAVPLYSEYNPANANPFVSYLPPNTSGKNLSDFYFRPVQGLDNFTEQDNAGSSNYNSLQIAARRNMTKHLSYGLAYTWSKIMAGSPDAYFTDQYRNYGPSFAPTPQMLSVNYVYEVPNLSKKLNFRPLGVITDHWTVSGITQWRSDIVAGVPGISFSGTTSTNPQMDWTGGADSARMFVTGSPNIPSSQVSFAGGGTASNVGLTGTPGNMIINPTVFTIPWPCSYQPGATPQKGIGQSFECFGDAGAGSIVTEPGTRVDNWDMTFQKSFPLKSEKRVLIFRAEMYNIFNHTQFSAANISPTYDWTNWQNGVLQQTNAQLNRYTSALNSRQMGFTLRFQF
jgi:hypothetical protein